MTEIVTGDPFGVDRIDYLLRDSLHAGVAYGRFDHQRVIDTLRILWDDEHQKAVVGIEGGGLHAAEGLQLARYFMFEQLYFHKVRRAFAPSHSSHAIGSRCSRQRSSFGGPRATWE